MKRNLITTIFLLITVAIASGHEFWLQPKKFRYEVGEEMKVDFMVGENFSGEAWDLGKHKVEKLEIHSTGVVKNVLKDLKPVKGSSLTYKFDKEGTHLLAMESNAAYIEMDGDKFNDYLKEDGMDYILDQRTQAGELQKPSKEYYKRYAKVLVQSGSKTDETFRKRVGFRYEIIPLTNPYTMKAGDYLQCRLMWEGKPAAHMLIKVWNIIGNKTFLQDIYTEDDGTIKFPISSPGKWMVSAVKMIPSEKAGADYQSLWSSLVFNIE